jgi:Ankyrin repeats (3 copies)
MYRGMGFLQGVLRVFGDIIPELVSMKAVHNSPFWTAIQNGDAAIVRVLLDSGANVDEPEEFRFNDFEISETLTCTPVMYAIYKKNYDLARLFIEAGADVNKQCEKVYQDADDAPVVKVITPLGVAIELANAASVRMLIDAGAKVDSADMNQATHLYSNDIAMMLFDHVQQQLRDAEKRNSELVQNIPMWCEHAAHDACLRNIKTGFV